MNRAPLLALALVFAVGCEEKTEPPKPAAPTPAAAPASGAAAAPASGAAALPSGDRGDLKGAVAVTGKIPAMEDLKRNSDALCAKKQMKDESVIAGKKGELANVAVHINGLPPTSPPAEKATLSQDDC